MTLENYNFATSPTNCCHIAPESARKWFFWQRWTVALIKQQIFQKLLNLSIIFIVLK